MSIKFAILGFLSWMPLTGYELKKLFADSELFHWSGNNNQIYTTLVQLHNENLVTKEVQHAESGPSSKRYTITDEGMAELKQWVLSQPELPQIRNSFLTQLAWADLLSSEELDRLLAQYEEEVYVKLLMLREQSQRKLVLPERTVREAALWQAIKGNQLSFYETELSWVQRLRQEMVSL